MQNAHAMAQSWLCHLLYANYEISVGHIAVGHARSVEGEAGVSFAIEEDKAAGGVGASGENAHGLVRGE